MKVCVHINERGIQSRSNPALKYKHVVSLTNAPSKFFLIVSYLKSIDKFTRMDININSCFFNMSSPQGMATGETGNSSTSSSEQSYYTIKGSVKYLNGEPVKGIKIQAMDSDQEVFQDHNDDVIAIASVNELDGTFEITFDSKPFKDGWLEGHPDLYLIVRHALDGHAIYKTEIRKGVKQNSPDLVFDIQINSVEEEYVDNQINKNSALYDPFQGNNDRVIAAFTRLGDVVQLIPGDIHRNFALLVSSINAWTVYTREDMWRIIGYDGPQVPRYPWQDDRHSHKLSWEEM